MSNISPKVSRVRTHPDCAKAESVLLAACESANRDGRPFTIVSGYDNQKIGSYTEYTIWYENNEDKP